jgi:hypothetical protein
LQPGLLSVELVGPSVGQLRAFAEPPTGAP